jgi:cell division septation protein DedD
MKDAGNGVEEIVPTAKPAPAKIASAGPPPLPVPKPAAKKAQLQKDEDTAADDADDDAATKKTTPKHAASPSSADAKYEVQLGSYAEIADAKKDWDRLKEKYASYLGNLKMRLVKVNVPDKGTRYHLQAGVITKDRAHEICAALKNAHGVGCILANR